MKKDNKVNPYDYFDISSKFKSIFHREDGSKWPHQYAIALGFYEECIPYKKILTVSMYRAYHIYYDALGSAYVLSSGDRVYLNGHENWFAYINETPLDQVTVERILSSCDMDSISNRIKEEINAEKIASEDTSKEMNDFRSLMEKFKNGKSKTEDSKKDFKCSCRPCIPDVNDISKSTYAICISNLQLSGSSGNHKFSENTVYDIVYISLGIADEAICYVLDDGHCYDLSLIEKSFVFVNNTELSKEEVQEIVNRKTEQEDKTEEDIQYHNYAYASKDCTLGIRGFEHSFKEGELHEVLFPYTENYDYTSFGVLNGYEFEAGELDNSPIKFLLNTTLSADDAKKIMEEIVRIENQ